MVYQTYHQALLYSQCDTKISIKFAQKEKANGIICDQVIDL